MPNDFRDSAERHWKDAGYLLTDSRIANADHLFGLSAECALKAIMVALGMALQPDGKPVERLYRKHINKLWTEFVSFANCRNGARYTSQLSVLSNPFTNWDIDQRYHHRSSVTLEVAEKHQHAAKVVKQVLDEAILNGDII